MRRSLSLLMSLGAASLLLISCNKELQQSPESGTTEQGAYPVTLSLSGVQTELRADALPDNQHPRELVTEAEPREKKVSDLLAVLFRRGGNEYVGSFDAQAVPGSADQFQFDAGQTGEYDLYVIANAESDLKDAIETQVQNVSQLMQLVATQEPGANNAADHFLMTSDKYEINVLYGSGAQVRSIKLTRAAARIDVYNTIEGLQLNKVELVNRYQSSHLYSQLNMNGLTVTPLTGYDVPNGVSLIGHIYTYENVNTAQDKYNAYSGDKETYLKLFCDYKGSALTEPIVVKFGTLPIKRNYLYSVVLSKQGSGPIIPGDGDDDDGDGYKVTIEVIDWNTGETFTVSGDALSGSVAPDFTVRPSQGVQGAGKNVSEITIDSSASQILLHTSSETISALIESKDLPEGWSIDSIGDSRISDGKIEQDFAITVMPNNGSENVEVNLIIRNPLKSDLARTLHITQKPM